MASPTSTKAARRRQRSTRITVAVALLGLAAVIVVAGVLGPVSWLTPVAAVVALLAGAAATRITYSELLASRVEAAADRAQLAQDYRWMSEARLGEHRTEVQTLRLQLRGKDEHVGELEQSLVLAERRVTDASRKLTSATRRHSEAAAEVTALTEQVARAEQRQADDQERIAEAARRAEDAESRAAEAIVRLVELEHEADALRAELDGWRTTEVRRKHA